MIEWLVVSVAVFQVVVPSSPSESCGAGLPSAIVTLDIETTHYDPTEGETVSVGLAVHDRGEPASEISYELCHREGPDDKVATIARTLERLGELDADALITYNSRDFDLDFLNERLRANERADVAAHLEPDLPHVDLYPERQRLADRRGDKWPGLEECLASYGYPEPVTVWNGQKVTNTRFGEELGPLYLEVLDADNDDVLEQLTPIIDHYLATDLEANLALYYGDIGTAFEPARLGERAEFDVLE